MELYKIRYNLYNYIFKDNYNYNNTKDYIFLWKYTIIMIFILLGCIFIYKLKYINLIGYLIIFVIILFIYIIYFEIALIINKIENDIYLKKYGDYYELSNIIFNESYDFIEDEEVLKYEDENKITNINDLITNIETNTNLDYYKDTNYLYIKLTENINEYIRNANFTIDNIPGTTRVNLDIDIATEKVINTISNIFDSKTKVYDYLTNINDTNFYINSGYLYIKIDVNDNIIYNNFISLINNITYVVETPGTIISYYNEPLKNELVSTTDGIISERINDITFFKHIFRSTNNLEYITYKSSELLVDNIVQRTAEKTTHNLFNYKIMNDISCTWREYNYDSNLGIFAVNESVYRYIDSKYEGDWIIIQFPSNIIINNYQIYSSSLGKPIDFKLYASKDFINWNKLDEVINASYNADSFFEKTFINNLPYSYYAIVVNKIHVTTGIANGLKIKRLFLNYKLLNIINTRYNYKIDNIDINIAVKNNPILLYPVILTESEIYLKFKLENLNFKYNENQYIMFFLNKIIDTINTNNNLTIINTKSYYLKILLTTITETNLRNHKFLNNYMYKLIDTLNLQIDPNNFILYATNNASADKLLKFLLEYQKIKNKIKYHMKYENNKIDEDINDEFYLTTKKNTDLLKYTDIYNIELVNKYLFIESLNNINDFFKDNIKDTFTIDSKDYYLINLQSVNDSFIKYINDKYDKNFINLNILYENPDIKIEIKIKELIKSFDYYYIKLIIVLLILITIICHIFYLELLR